MPQPQSHVEVVIELKPGHRREQVERWCRERGLTTLSVVVGVLVMGDAAAIAAAFGDATADGLPVPDALAKHIASVVVVAPRKLHDRH